VLAAGDVRSGSIKRVASAVFFRAAAGLDVDKDDRIRDRDFVDQKLYDLVVVAQAAAKANGRDVIQPSDLPITKGLQECIREFQGIDEDVELQPILDQLAARPARPVPRRGHRGASPRHRGWAERGAGPG
jgi:hypothetical protein